MLKSTFRFALLFVAAALISAVAASSAYFITKNILSKEDVTPAATTVEASPLTAPSDTKDTDAMEFEAYIVRLEENAICVYALSNKSEEFLYSTDIYRLNLSDEDIRLLSSGVTLDTSSELTGFMENYTS